MSRIAPTEFESHAAKHQHEQHGNGRSHRQGKAVEAAWSPTVRNAEQNQWRAVGIALVTAFHRHRHRHHLGRLVLQRVQPIQVAHYDSQRRGNGRHPHGHQKHDARADWSGP